MLEILQFYVSGFWVWCGITIALAMVLTGITRLIVCTITVARGGSVKFGKDS